MSDLAFDPEYSWNYEVGFKSSWFNNRVNFNTSLFYIDLSDQQVTQVLPTANTVIRNAGKSRSMGFEVEASALITEGLLFEGSFGYTDAKYRRYSDKVSGSHPRKSGRKGCPYRKGTSSTYCGYAQNRRIFPAQVRSPAYAAFQDL